MMSYGNELPGTGLAGAHVEEAQSITALTVESMALRAPLPALLARMENR
jgi:hypothetical protein